MAVYFVKSKEESLSDASKIVFLGEKAERRK